MPKLSQSSRAVRAMRYDVCLSFVDENRDYVLRVAEELKRRKVRVFYDNFEVAELWGKNLYTHLDEIYQHSAHFCVMFVSEQCAEKTRAAIIDAL
jgi:hypothetical protein